RGWPAPRRIACDKSARRGGGRHRPWPASRRGSANTCESFPRRKPPAGPPRPIRRMPPLPAARGSGADVFRRPTDCIASPPAAPPASPPRDAAPFATALRPGHAWPGGTNSNLRLRASSLVVRREAAVGGLRGLGSKQDFRCAWLILAATAWIVLRGGVGGGGGVFKGLGERSAFRIGPGQQQNALFGP